MTTAAKSAETPVAEASGVGKYILVASIALVIVVFDQITKIWIDADMKLYQSIPILDGVFNLTYVRNTGAAFSMFADMSETYRVPFFASVAVVAVLAILYFVYSTPPSQKVVLIACGFVLGGALGNLIDRVTYGSVIDFLDVYYGDWHWPAFNVADSFISTGVVLLLLSSVFTKD
ncbi:MAG: signal peptidase II [Candidatus Binatia bacterium]|nr:signal peptidase II [Candidatus Binatia bacterium]